MADDNKAEISVGAKIDEAVQAIAELQGHFQTFSSDVSKRLNEVSSASDHLLSKIKELTAGFLSLESMRRAIDATTELGKEAIKLGAIFGISQTEASQFAVALNDVHATSEQAEHAAAFMARQLRGNEEALNRVGLATRDSSGTLKDQKTLFLDAIDTINSYKAGTDRNAVAVQLFGRGALEMHEILKLTPEILEEARLKADELGLTLTQQGAVTVMNYRDAMQNLKDVMLAFQKVMGEALMPIITDVGNWFSGMGKDAVAGFRVTVNIVASAINGLVMVFQTVAEVFAAFVKTLTTGGVMIADIFMALQHGDWDGVRTAWENGTQGIEDAWTTGMDNIVKNAEATRKRLADLWNKDESGSTPEPGGGKAYTPVNKNLLAQLEAALAQEKSWYESALAAQGEFRRYSLEMESGYWAEVLATQSLSLDERAKVETKFWNLETEIGRQAMAGQIMDLKARAAAYKEDLDTRLSFARKEAEMVARADPAGPKGPQAMGAQKQVEDLQRQIQTRAAAITEVWAKASDDQAQKGIETQRTMLSTEQQMFKISKLQELTSLQPLLAQEFEIKRAAVQRQIDAEEEKKQAGLDWSLQKEQELEAQKLTINADYLQKKLALEQQQVLEANKFNLQAQQGVQQAFASFFFDLTDKVQSLSQAFRNLGIAILQVFARVIAAKFAENLFGPGTAGGRLVDIIVRPMTDAIGKMLSGWVGGETAMTAATTTATATREALQTAAAVEGAISAKTTALSEISAWAGVAAAAAMASVAAIPFVGWAMAPAVGAETFATAMSYAATSMLSAAEGFDVPRGVNPVTKLHGGEMVLPPPLADRVRDMTGGGAGGNITINAVDARSVKRLFMNEGGALVKSLQAQIRNFKGLGS